jgi:phosphate transport system permease protein
VRASVRWTERIIETALFLAAASSVLITVGIVFVLVYESSTFFEHVSLTEFVTDPLWTPLFDNPHYGIMPLVAGTFLSTMVALLVAVPFGMVIAIYLSEFAPARLREVIKPILEMLSSVPTVVYGYFALLFVTPLLKATLFPDLPGFNILAGGIVIGIMIIPYVSSVSEDAMRAVPMSMREGSYAMGATRLETAWKVVVPAAVSGIVAAFILGISRASSQT